MAVVLAVAQTREDADKLRQMTAHMKGFLVSFCGQAILGVHYRGQRPNVLLRLYETADPEWERQCLIPALQRGATII